MINSRKQYQRLLYLRTIQEDAAEQEMFKARHRLETFEYLISTVDSEMANAKADQSRQWESGDLTSAALRAQTIMGLTETVDVCKGELHLRQGEYNQRVHMYLSSKVEKLKCAEIAENLQSGRSKSLLRLEQVSLDDTFLSRKRRLV